MFIIVETLLTTSYCAIIAQLNIGIIIIIVYNIYDITEISFYINDIYLIHYDCYYLI